MSPELPLHADVPSHEPQPIEPFNFKRIDQKEMLENILFFKSSSSKQTQYLQWKLTCVVFTSIRSNTVGITCRRRHRRHNCRAVAKVIRTIAAAGVVITTTNNTLSSTARLSVSTASIISLAVSDEGRDPNWPASTKVEAKVRERKKERKRIH